MKSRWLCALGLALGTTAAIAATSCAPEFTPQYRLTSLRVLGVQVGPEAYGKPSENRSLSMMLYDGEANAAENPDDPSSPRRPVQILWLGGCHNPQGDQYLACLPIYQQRLQKLTAAADGGSLSAEDIQDLKEIKIGYLGTPPDGAPPPFPPGADPLTFTQSFPEDIIQHESGQGENSKYGLSFVFFIVCGGVIGEAEPSVKTSGFPLGCYDGKTGEQLDANSFVIGYTPIYSYEKVENQNPIISAGVFNGKPMTAVACEKDTDCQEKEACGSLNICIPVIDHCTSKTLADCPEIDFKPTISRDSIEIDETAEVDPDGTKLQEIIWVNYYTTDGVIGSEVRLVNDATKGWNEDYGTKWQAPNAEAGEVRLWAVAHDNRGGTAWISQDFKVK